VPAAGAATIAVNTEADAVGADGHCSLREAITSANTDKAPFTGAGECAAGSGTDTVLVPAGHFALSLGTAEEDNNAGGDLDLRSNMTISGAGAGATTIDAKGIDRVFQVLSGRIVTIQGVTITGGMTPGGRPGFEQTGENGTGTADGNDAFAGSGGAGESGGGIFNAGALTIIDSTITHNTTGAGGKGGNAYGGEGGSAGGKGGLAFGGDGGDGGSGGGVFNAGVLTLVRTTVTANVTGPGGAGSTAVGGDGGLGKNAGFGDPGTGGNGGAGGGVAESGAAALAIDQGTISANRTGEGGEGGFGFGGTGGNGSGSGSGAFGGEGVGANGGYGGYGGGISIRTPPFGGDTAQLTNSLIEGNSTGAGALAGNGVAGNGGTGGSSAGTGGTGGEGIGGFGGPGGYGGGLYAAEKDAWSATNVTVTGNLTGSGGEAGNGFGGKGGLGGAGGGNGGPGGLGAGSDGGFNGLGGGVASGATSTSTNATISSNTVGASGAGTPGEGGKGGAGNGGGASGAPGTTLAGAPGAHLPSGLDSFSEASTTLANTILAANGPPNCEGMLLDGGHDISFPDASCPGANVDPLLMALADNGGPTETQALSAGSPALDAVPASGAGCPATDQRGVSRPQGPACDIGAFELFVPVPPVASMPSAGSTGGPAGGPATGGGGVTLASIGRLTLAPNAFPAAPSGPSALVAKRRYGTRVTFTLNEPASVRFTVVRPASGRRGAHGRCVKLTRSNRHSRKCVLLESVPGSFRRSGGAGASSFRFTGRLGGRSLRPGGYRLLAAPTAGGRTGVGTSAAFRITR
jgi:CSLREA domain-containing protein